MPVIMPIEQQHAIPSRRRPGHPDRFDIRGRSRQRELPLRQFITASQLLCHHDGVFRRQQELGPELHLLANGLNHRRRAVAAESGDVGDVRVYVLVSVDVDEPCPSTGAHVDGQLVIGGHPRHGHAVRH